MFCLLTFVLSVLGDSALDFKDMTTKLQNVYRKSTFYDLFGISETSKPEIIRKAFLSEIRKYRGNDEKSLEYKKILNFGYNILTSYRKEYDDFLNSSFYSYLQENAKTPFNGIFIKVIMIIAIAIITDVILYSVRVLRYESMVAKAKDIEKEKGSRKQVMKMRKRLKNPEMFLYILIKKLNIL